MSHDARTVHDTASAPLDQELLARTESHWHWPTGITVHCKLTIFDRVAVEEQMVVRDAHFGPRGVVVGRAAFPFAGAPISATLAENPQAAELVLKLCTVPGHIYLLAVPIPDGRIEEARRIQRLINTTAHGG